MPLALLVKRKETSLFWACLFFLSFQGTVYGFLKKEKVSKNSPLTDVAQNFSYRVFFIVEPSVKDPDSKKAWVEINYKLVDGKDVPGPLFPEAPGGKVCFLDKDGYVLASDYFLNEDFQKTDFYGTLTVDKRRAAAIVSADAKPLREGELEALRRERAERDAQKKREEEMFLKAIGGSSSLDSENRAELRAPESAKASPSIQQPQPQTQTSPQAEAPAQASQISEVAPSPVSADAPQAVQSPAALQPGASAEPSPMYTEQKQVTEASAQVKIPPSVPDKKKELLDLGGTTNDDIQQTLLEREKQPATEVIESPSEIPGISADNEQPNVAE